MSPAERFKVAIQGFAPLLQQMPMPVPVLGGAMIGFVTKLPVTDDDALAASSGLRDYMAELAAFVSGETDTPPQIPFKPEEPPWKKAGLN